MTFIIIVAIIIYIILSVWCWHNMGSIEKNKKISYIVIGIFIMFIITNIILGVSKNELNYSDSNIEKMTSNILIFIFTGLNGLITMPYLSKQLDKIHENEVEKDKFAKKITVILILFFICLFFECGYLKDTQEGILKIYNSLRLN